MWRLMMLVSLKVTLVTAEVGIFVECAAVVHPVQNNKTKQQQNTNKEALLIQCGG